MSWTVLLSSEIKQWYDSLSIKGKASTLRSLDLLQEHGNRLRMPHSKPLGNGLFELRFVCENTHRRITYIFDVERKIITLTTFRKQKNNEVREIIRARRAQKEKR